MFFYKYLCSRNTCFYNYADFANIILFENLFFFLTLMDSDNFLDLYLLQNIIFIAIHTYVYLPEIKVRSTGSVGFCFVLE